MQEINSIMEKLADFKVDKERDYSSFYNMMTKILDQQNFLLLTEAFQCLKHIFRIFGSQIPSNKMSQFIVLVTEKLTGKEKAYKNLNAYELLTSALTHNCIPIMKILDIMLDKIRYHKNQGVVRGCLKWLIEHFMKPFYEKSVSENPEK